MSFTVDWVDSRHTAIHANFIDHWDWSEFYGALENAHKLMLKSNRHITLMLDFIGSKKATSTDALQAIADEMTSPNNLVRIVIVSDDTNLSKKMFALLQRIYPEAHDIHNTDNHQEASELSREVVLI
jgi:hypothetical protein